jgi:hypothetical protein
MTGSTAMAPGSTMTVSGASKNPNVQREAIMHAPAELLRDALAQRAAKDAKDSAMELGRLGLSTN